MPPSAGPLTTQEVVAVTDLEHCVFAHGDLAHVIGHKERAPSILAIAAGTDGQARVIGAVDPVNRGFQKKGNSISRDNYCHLVSDTAIRPPDICVSLHSIILYHSHAQVIGYRRSSGTPCILLSIQC